MILNIISDAAIRKTEAHNPVGKEIKARNGFGSFDAAIFVIKEPNINIIIVLIMLVNMA